ncbi:SGNH/GDSL hydrolase family protein [Cohnella hongkongensis]|uniref:SGNH/GDSL hydrolase family protein n=1 Tax=Cohnella hongkongensis TaxID=178337 RepID=A0ABV9FAC3_9BACL
MPEMKVENIALDYEGTWSAKASAEAGLGSLHETCGAADQDAAARWQGAFRSAKIYAATGDYGIAEIWVDGKRRRVVDLYSSSERHGMLVCSLDDLEAGFHTLEIRKSGRKNERSSSCRLNLDYLELDFIRPSNVHYRQIVCIGDSITFGANVDDRPRGLFGRKLQGMLAVPVSVHGLSGATIRTVTSVLDAVAAPRKPDLLLWLAGMNDESPYAPMVQGIDRVREQMPDTELIVSNIPYNTYYSEDQNRRKADEVRQACREKSVPCIDLYGMTYGNDWLHRPENTVHPNSEGHSVIASAFYREIMRRCSSTARPPLPSTAD